MASSNITPRKRGSNKLLDKERIFVHEYMANDEFNAAKAARKAGYNFPAQASNKLLKKKRVRDYLGKKLRERLESIDVIAKDVIKELVMMAFFDPVDAYDEDGNLLPINEMPSHCRRNLHAITYKELKDGTVVGQPRWYNKQTALELLGKHMGMFSEEIKLDHGFSGEVIGQILHHLEHDRNNGSAIVDAKVIEENV